VDRLRSYAASEPRRFAEALSAATNEITRRTPAPRDFPFFGLDHSPGADARRLERLSELGIFRVYERVLDLSAGLGGPARWLARRRGCSVISFDPDSQRAAASRLLVARAHLERAVAVGVAGFGRLPVATASFTHAWGVEALGAADDASPVVAELFRAVRPGGHVALQEWTSSDSSARIDRYLAALAAAGFLDVRVVGADEPEVDEAAIAGILRERVIELLGAHTSAEVPPVHVGGGIEPGRSLVQLFARRPS
jgi:SAM-dependent methyltransferase